MLNPELIEGLKSPGYWFRWKSAEALGKLGRGAKTAAPALAEALEDSNETTRHTAAKALAAIGSEAEAAIPALVKAIKREQSKRSGTGSDTPSILSWLAGNALAQIGPASLPALITLLSHEDRYVRLSAVNAVGNMGPQAKDAIPALSEALNDEDELVRQWVSVALERIANRRPVTGSPVF